MPITLPKAGTIAGRAAQVQVGVPETGTLIGQFGSRLQEHALRWKEEQRRAKVQQDELNITRDLGQARLEVEQLGDPDQIGPAWDARVAEIQGKYITPDTDPEVAKALGLSMQALGDRHALALGEKSVNLRRSAQEAAWIDMRQAITTDAATADPTTFQALIEVGEAAIDQRAAKGLIDPATAAAEKQALRAEVYGARATTALEADPAALLAAAEAGDYDALGAEGVAKLMLDAQGEIDRRTAAQAKADEVALKGRKTAVIGRLGEIATLASKGRLVVDEQEVNSPELIALAEAYPEVAEARRKAIGALELRKSIPDLELLPVAELDKLIAEEQARATTEGWENAKLEALIAMRDRKATGYDTNPKATARASGLPAPALPPFDPDNPGEFAKALFDSMVADQALRESGHAKRPAIFDTEEKAALKPILAPTAEAAPKLALMDAILQGTGGNAAPVLAELEADPVFRRGLKLYSVTGDKTLTEALLRGGQKVAEKTILMPSETDQIRLFNELIGGTLADLPMPVQKEIMMATAALYADGASAIDPANDPDAFAEAYGVALQRVLGAQPDQNGELTIGGLQEVNGALTVLPPGVAVREVEGALDVLATRLEGRTEAAGYGQQKMIEDTLAVAEGSDAVAPSVVFAPFKAASLYGGLPDLGADPTAIWDSLTLRRVGESDVYELVYDRNGRLTPIREQGKDHAYRFRLKDLIRGARP